MWYRGHDASTGIVQYGVFGHMATENGFGHISMRSYAFECGACRTPQRCSRPKFFFPSFWHDSGNLTNRDLRLDYFAGEESPSYTERSLLLKLFCARSKSAT